MVVTRRTPRWDGTNARNDGRVHRAPDSPLEGGPFDDPVWVAELLDRFAIHYFDAVDSWDAGGDCTPIPWVVAFGATTGPRETSALQLLLAGVNAHINYDLVLTLIDLLDSGWRELDPDTLATRRRDYDRVNEIIAATADEVQDLVVERYAPSLAVADVVLGRVDEWLAVRLLTSWREDVWRHATAVLDDDLVARSQILERRASRCARRGRLILLRA